SEEHTSELQSRRDLVCRLLLEKKKRDFYEGEYRRDPQPDSFLEVNQFWNNFSIDAFVQPRVNNFLETVERLPDVRLTGFRQQRGTTPFYYESESSAGYYRRVFAENAGTN